MIPYHDLFSQASEWSGIPAYVLAAMCYVESRFDPKAHNEESGAMGMAQFMPATWEEWGQGDAYDPQNAIVAMASYLMYLEKQVGSSWWAIVAYHHGLGRVFNLVESGDTFLEIVLRLEPSALKYVNDVLTQALNLQLEHRQSV